MRIPYPKPNKLSDPYYDWDGCEERLIQILAKEPTALTAEDYGVIFYQNLPAAAYEEGCYYVPYFLSFLRSAPDLDYYECQGFFWYIDHFRTVLPTTDCWMKFLRVFGVHSVI
jgi:hypothetical protein